MKIKLTNLSIFNQLIILFLGLVIFINASLTTIFFFINKNSAKKHIYETVQQQYLFIENDFEYMKNILFQELRILSKNPVLNDYMASSENEKLIYANKVKNVFRSYTKDKKGYECVCFRNIYGEEEISILKKNKQTGQIEIAEKIIFDALKNKTGENIYFFGPYKDEVGKILFSLGISTIDQDVGRFGGTVNITYDFEKFIELAKNIRIYGINPIWIYSTGGDILYKPSEEINTFNPLKYLKNEINLDTKIFSVKEGLYGYKDFFITEDKPLVRIAIVVPSKIIDRDINKTIMVFTLVFIVSVIIAFLVVAFISKHFSKPIVELSNISKDIAKGDFSKRINIHATGELNYLTENFNKMAETLQNTTVSRDALLKEVEDRKKAEDKLVEYNKKIEEVNKELDDFTYIVSHDLKEPLRSINAFSKFVMSDYKEKLDEEGKNYLERIQANVNLMQKLIEDLLEVSRLERRKNPFEDADTGNMLNDIKLRMDRSLTEKRVKMVVSDKMPVVFCDRVRLTEVFANLISNALKYMNKTFPFVEVGYKDTADYHEFFVKDNGPGIPEEYHKKIFKIFQRLVKKEEKEGTGVGLTIVKKIVEMHKGRIWLESKVGEGTTFYFTITKNRDLILGEKKTGETLIEKKIVDEDTIKKAMQEQKKKES